MIGGFTRRSKKSETYFSGKTDLIRRNQSVPVTDELEIKSRPYSRGNPVVGTEWGCLQKVRPSYAPVFLPVCVVRSMSNNEKRVTHQYRTENGRRL